MPGLNCTYDFGAYDAAIENCPVLPPISAELALYCDFVRQANDFDDDEHIMGPTAVKAAGVKGMDTFYKKDGRAEMTFAVGGRFLLALKAGKQKDMALLKSVAESMDLAKLAKL